MYTPRQIILLVASLALLTAAAPITEPEAAKARAELYLPTLYEGEGYKPSVYARIEEDKREAYKPSVYARIEEDKREAYKPSVYARDATV